MRLPSRCCQGCGHLQAWLGKGLWPSSLMWLLAEFSSWPAGGWRLSLVSCCVGLSIEQLTIQDQSKQVSGKGAGGGSASHCLFSLISAVTPHQFCQVPLVRGGSKSSPYRREGITQGCEWGKLGITKSLLKVRPAQALPFNNHNSLVREVLLSHFIDEEKEARTV